jgi:hypothetical protein
VSSNRSYSVGYKPTSVGTYYFRVVFDGSSDYKASNSKTLSVAVHR